MSVVRECRDFHLGAQGFRTHRGGGEFLGRLSRPFGEALEAAGGLLIQGYRQGAHRLLGCVANEH